MPSTSEYPFGLLSGGGVLVGLLVLTAGDYAALTGSGPAESGAVLLGVPLVVAGVAAAVVRDRLTTARRAALFVGGVAMLVSILELAVVGVARYGIGPGAAAGAVLSVVGGVVVQRLRG